MPRRAAFLRRRDSRFRKTCCRGMLATHGRRRCISTILFCWTAQNNLAVFWCSSHNSIPQAGQAVLPRRCPTFWSDPHNRDSYVLSGSGWKQRLSIHAPSHIATKHFFRFPASHPEVSAPYFSPGATGRQWQGNRSANNIPCLGDGLSNMGSHPRGSAC